MRRRTISRNKKKTLKRSNPLDKEIQMPQMGAEAKGLTDLLPISEREDNKYQISNNHTDHPSLAEGTLRW
tara:strand:+ start:537 stop:746 length:210 start_codon:yes stop_codon:yes gene_type:complete